MQNCCKKNDHKYLPEDKSLFRQVMKKSMDDEYQEYFTEKVHAPQIKKSILEKSQYSCD